MLQSEMRSFLPVSILILSLTGSSVALAESTANDVAETQIAPPVEHPKPRSEAVNIKKPAPEKSSRETRLDKTFFALGTFSYFDMILLAKIGATIGLNRDADTSWELEYLRGSLAVPIFGYDLGSVTDERLSLVRRSYFGGNSFNLSYGLTYFRVQVHLGDAIMNRVSSGAYPNLDMVDVQSLGFNLGIGNRWSIGPNFTVGIDWFEWSQPVYSLKRESAFVQYASNQNDRDNVDTAVKIISFVPRFTVLKLQAGMSF